MCERRIAVAHADELVLRSPAMAARRIAEYLPSATKNGTLVMP
jgi:hypothetical protein